MDSSVWSVFELPISFAQSLLMKAALEHNSKDGPKGSGDLTESALLLPGCFAEMDLSVTAPIYSSIWKEWLPTCDELQSNIELL